MTWFCLAVWGLGAGSVWALWLVRDCPTWGDVGRKLRSPIPRARVRRR